MTLGSLVVLLLVAGVCGAIGKSIAGYDRGGCLASIALGFIGAFLGVWVADKFDLPRMWVVRIGGEPFPILWSIIGSAVFVAILGFFTRRKN